MTKYYQDKNGAPLGGFDGTNPPAGAAEITEPEYAAMIKTPDEPSELEILKDALKTKGHISDADLTTAKNKLKGQ